MLSVWIKNFKQTQVYNYLYGTRIGLPVQIVLKLGAGVIDLIKTPVDEYQKGGNILKGKIDKNWDDRLRTGIWSHVLSSEN
jgi:hypothetical protein